MRFHAFDLLLYFHLRFHALWALRDVHAFWPLRDFLVIFCSFLLRNFLMTFPYDILCVLQYNFRMRFPFEILCFLLYSFLVRCPYLMSCFFRPLWGFRIRFVHLGPLCDVMRFPYEMSCFWIVMRFSYDFFAFCWILFWWGVICFFDRYEISSWDAMLFVAYFVLIYVSPKSPPWNAS